MPRKKDLKRLVRGRMQKTGESYTGARSRLISEKSSPPLDYAALAGMSDDAVRARTGRDWAGWVAALDAIDASRMSHGDIAAHVHADFAVGDWWGQMVAVGYERIRGLRKIGQRRDGTYEASKSKTFPVALETLFEAFTSKQMRNRWLGGDDPAIRKATPGKSVRMLWLDGTPAEALFTAKGAGKSQVAIQHRKLASKAVADERKLFWSAALDRLGGLLS
jgi:hypothetical protein